MMKKFTLALLSLLLVPLGMMAQNVTIKATNGSTIAAVKQGGTTDSFFGAGGFATWQHEQLSMVLTVSDNTDLTQNGQLDNPANNLFTSGSYIQVAKGQASGANVCYVSLSLPKGYRFTGYEIVFSKSNETKGSGNGAISFSSNVSAIFGETASDFGTYTTSGTVTNNGGTATISRTEMNEGEMSNVLYFKLTTSSANNRALVTLQSAEFFFTAEEDYSPVVPATSIESPVSAVDAPFSTSKVDYGTVQNRTYTINGRTYTRMSYSSADVTDLSAYFKLYEAESVVDGTDIDGVPGKIVNYGAGTISSEAGYFKLGRSDREQIYYIESPTSVTLSDGTKNPVGYRIIGAEFEYANQVVAERVFYITHVYDGDTYYLYTNGSNVSWSTTNRTTWTMDADGYISGNGYYLYFNQGYAGVQRAKPGESERFAVGEDGIYQLGWPDYYIRWYRVQTGWGWGGPTYTNYCLISKDNGVNATYTEQSSSTDNTGDFTLKVYDKTGANPITRTDGNGKVSLTGLNNDAVKFGVQGIGLVRATLTLQALDPYLDHMTVNCLDDDTELQTPIKLSQTFTASDFSVSGGEFYFYLPSDCAGHQVDISFEDLSSKYFDETYTGGSSNHTSRINFVRSAHYDAFGTSQNKLYNNVSEAANAQLERLKVGTVGTAAFKFNNADEVGTSGGTLTEYPFSLEKYAAAPNNGEFTDMSFTVSAEDQSLTRYVFTTDETRYNIAPTTAVQHRAYAFYEMIVHVQTQTYEPKVEFKKVYNQTLYGTGQTDAFYGVKVTAYDGNTPPKAGYASTTEIFRHINNAITNKVDDFGNTDIPTDSKYMLYLDLSEMAGIYQTTDEQHGSMADFSATGAKNLLVFIPVGASAPNNNVAYKMESGGFHAAHDIVLTDKEPFYSPYDITVDAANKITYSRLITKDKYGKVQNASLIMPFAVSVDGGTHTNIDGSTFSLHYMQETAALTQIEGTTYAYFPALVDVTTTEANTPYLVQLSTNSSEDGVSFVVTQPGTTIKATTTMNATDYTFTGETSTGTATEGDAEGTYNFTSKGTYAGAKIPKADNVFYFAKNQFVNSGNLAEGYNYANIAPFRAYFATSSTGAKLSAFDIIFGEGQGDVPTGIQAVDASQFIDINAPVYDMQGRMVSPTYRELSGKNLQKGFYVVNGVKFIVK
ncbi:MAG: hypothetical protein K6C10_02250 [Prevotella sp.]|nr:hypothetical protein [Prevotella sp.]